MKKHFGTELKRARNRAGFSQFQFGLRANVSARHISFLESGRSSPSREMVMRLADCLDLPLRERNRLLLAAGFAPLYSQLQLDETAMAPIRHALHFILNRQEPYPAFVLDRHWQIVMWNRVHEALIRQFLPDRDPSQLNAFDLVFEHDQLRTLIRNWEQVALALHRRIERQLLRLGSDPILEQRLTRIKSEGLNSSNENNHDLLIPLQLQWRGHRFSWFSTLAGFGNARDVTVEELEIECFFPADQATADLVETWTTEPTA